MLIIPDKPLIEHVYEYNTILVPMNIYNSFNKGFRYEIALNFPEVKKYEETTNYGDRRKYGTTIDVVTDGIRFILCYMYKINFAGLVDTVDYDSLNRCLESISKRGIKGGIASTILGASVYDGNGDKEKILSIFNKTIPEIDIYDYAQKDFSHEMFKKIAYLYKEREKQNISDDEYSKERSKVEWIRTNGIYKPMPENYKYNKKTKKYGISED